MRLSVRTTLFVVLNWMALGCHPQTSSVLGTSHRESDESRPVVLYDLENGELENSAFGTEWPNAGRYRPRCPDLAVDRHENVFVAGATHGWVFIENDDDVVHYPLHIGRVTQDGRLVWSRTLHNVWRFAGMAIDANTHSVGFSLGGMAQRETDWGTLRVPPGAFVSAWDPDGRVRWVRSLGLNARVQRVLVGPSGETTVIAHERSGRKKDWEETDRERHLIVARFDADGALMWTRRIAGWQGDQIYDSHNAFAGGSNDRFGALHGAALYLWYFPCDDARCTENAIVLKLDEHGKEIWRKTVVTAARPGTLAPPRLAVDSKGSLYAFGGYRDEIVIQGNRYRWPELSKYDDGGGAFFMKIGATGEIAFSTELDTDRRGLYANGLVVDAQDHPWLDGAFLRFVGFSSNNHALLRPRGPGNAPFPAAEFLARYDANGNSTDAFAVAFGAVVAMTRGADAIYMTTEYTGDLLLPGIDAPHTYDKTTGCAVLRIPTTGWPARNTH